MGQFWIPKILIWCYNLLRIRCCTLDHFYITLFIWTHQICWFRSFLLIWAIFIDFRVHTAKSIDFNRPRLWAPTVCTLKSRFLPWAPPKLLISSRFLLIWCKNIDMKSTFLATPDSKLCEFLCQPWFFLRSQWFDMLMMYEEISCHLESNQGKQPL